MYRLRERFRVGRDIDWPGLYSTVDDAAAVAARILRDWPEHRGARRPTAILIVDTVTGEIVTRERPYRDVDYDPDPFAGGQTDGRQSPPYPAGAAGGAQLARRGHFAARAGRAPVVTVPGELTITAGLSVERRRIGRVWSVDVHCSSCGERLANGTDTAAVLRLAATNVAARPCCTAWET